MVLRPLTVEDRRVVNGWLKDGETAMFMGADLGPWEVAVPSPEKIAMAIDTLGGRFIGYLALRDVSWRLREAELRICIGDKDFRGRGLGADALRTYLGYIFGTVRLRRVYLRVYADNRRAIRCYLKCGFRPRGILWAGRRRMLGFRDLVLMEASLA